MRKLLLLLLLLLGAVLLVYLAGRCRPTPPPGPAPDYTAALPNPRLTPGDVLTTDAAAVCAPGYARRVRDVPQSVKNGVYRAYGITRREPGEYEVDHLISLELGGSNSARNLWPESYRTQPLNARVKDRLENALHEQVCAGRVSLPDAQTAIAADWVRAYRRYVGPLPAGAASPTGAAGNDTGDTVAAGAAPHPDGSCPVAAPVKVSRSGISHVPGDPQYERTRARRCFPSAQAAAAAGYRAPRH